MKVVSVLNYKGGVGKTTLTANLGAALARRGMKILLIDMDPQSNLTFCFYHPDEWRQELRDSHTIKQWFDSFSNGRPRISLGDVTKPPSRVNASLRHNGGQLDLIASHLHLINLDLDLATDLRGDDQQARAELFQVRRALAVALNNDPIPSYDFVLIDCPPSFNILTQSAIVASSHILIPARADYLSTIGIEFLYGALHDLVELHNGQVGRHRLGGHEKISPTIAGVVFTMIQFYAQHPVATQQYYMDRVRQLGVPIFRAVMRHNVPAIWQPSAAGYPHDTERTPQFADLR